MKSCSFILTFYSFTIVAYLRERYIGYVIKETRITVMYEVNCDVETLLVSVYAAFFSFVMKRGDNGFDASK